MRQRSEILQILATIPRSIRTQLGIAVMFIVLGFGNMIFANVRLNDYLALLDKARYEIRERSHERVRDLPVYLPSLNLDEQTRYINKLKARIDFYEFVIMGGKCFLTLAGVLLLGCLPRLGQSFESAAARNDSGDEQ